MLKPTTNGNYKIYSPSIYDAVLDNGVETVAGFLQAFKPLVPEKFKKAFELAINQIGENFWYLGSLQESQTVELDQV